MFNIEKYIKIRSADLKRDDDGRIIVHMNISIDNDEIQKELEELYDSLQNLHKILGYDFTLIVDENDIFLKS